MKNKNGFSLIELLLVLIIVSVLSYFLLKNYFKSPEIDQDTKKEMAQQGMNPESYPSIIQTAKEKATEFNKKSTERQKEVQNPEQ